MCHQDCLHSPQPPYDQTPWPEKINRFHWITVSLIRILTFSSCLSIVYWKITMDYILINYCLKQWNYQNLVARFDGNINTECKQHREPKSLTLIGALNGVIKFLSGWRIKFLTNRTTEKHEITSKFRKFICPACR